MARPHPLSLLALALGLGALRLPAAEGDAAPPWSGSSRDVETGLLWQMGHSTPLAYRLVPTQLSWRSPEFLAHAFADGTRLVVRHRWTLLGTWVQQGPESHYLALDGSPSVELWNRAGTWAAYCGSGGGFGWLDSQAVRGAQGQDFTFNWFARGGIEHVVRRNRHLLAGVMFQHMSNGGQTKPNPGIDAVGFSVGYAWSY